MDSNVWDSKSKFVDYKGLTIETFTRSALAKALNRKIGTIRKMEMDGVLCTPLLRDGRGWWAYTRDQIEDLVKLATEEGVLDPSYRRPFTARFAREAKQILNRLPM